MFVVVSSLLFLSALLGYFCFSEATHEPSLRSEQTKQYYDLQEEVIPFKRRRSIIVPGWKEMLQHCFVDNTISRSIIIIYLINAACFHADLVMTSNFLVAYSHQQKYSQMQNLVAYGNILGGFGSLLTIWYLSNLDKSPRLYYGYMKLTIWVSILTTALSPFVIQLMFYDQPHYQMIIYVFFLLK